MRWSNQDKILKLTYKEIKSSFQELKNQIEDLTYTLDLNFDEINNIGNRQKRILQTSKLNQDELLLFFKKKARSNRDILFVLLFNLYLNQTDSINKLSNKVLNEVSKDSLSKLPFKASVDNPLQYALILNSPLYLYLKSLAYTDALEAQRTILTSLQNQSELSLDRLIEKQRKRILNINEDKYSGVLHDVSIRVANESYVEPLRKENHKVKFIAIEDERTTPMCNSMDGMIFNTVDKNSFDRETGEGLQHFEVDGLVSGINLPPITNFTHHCRSWVELVE